MSIGLSAPALLFTAGAPAQEVGAIVVWGADDWDQCTVPAPNENFVAASHGGDHVLGLKADGSVVAWGRNSQGQCNVPSPNSRRCARRRTPIGWGG